MRKYNEEYFSVIEKRTGKKIVDCGDREDALMMLYIDPQNRQFVKNKVMMSPVVDIDVPKALPTTEIVGAGGSDRKSTAVDGNGMSALPQIKLPEGEGKPVVI